MLDTQRSVRAADELIDPAAIVDDLKKLAKMHAGRERELRTAVAQRLKSALSEARVRAEALLLKDRHGRRCAERLCRTQDEIIRILFDFAVTELIRRACRRRRSTWRSSAPAATAAACWHPAPTSICCFCCPTSKPRGASRSPRRCSIAC